MGLFDQDIANSSKISDEDKAKYKAVTDKANAKEAARYKSGPNRDDMTTRRVVAAKRARRAKVEGYKKGGKIDGIAMKGKTKGRMC